MADCNINVSGGNLHMLGCNINMVGRNNRFFMPPPAESTIITQEEVFLSDDDADEMLQPYEAEAEYDDNDDLSGFDGQSCLFSDLDSQPSDGEFIQSLDKVSSDFSEDSDVGGGAPLYDDDTVELALPALADNEVIEGTPLEEESNADVLFTDDETVELDLPSMTGNESIDGASLENEKAFELVMPSIDGNGTSNGVVLQEEYNGGVPLGDEQPGKLVRPPPNGVEIVNLADGLLIFAVGEDEPRNFDMRWLKDVFDNDKRVIQPEDLDLTEGESEIESSDDDRTPANSVHSVDYRVLDDNDRQIADILELNDNAIEELTYNEEVFDWYEWALEE